MIALQFVEIQLHEASNEKKTKKTKNNYKTSTWKLSKKEVSK